MAQVSTSRPIRRIDWFQAFFGCPVNGPGPYLIVAGKHGLLRRRGSSSFHQRQIRGLAPHGSATTAEIEFCGEPLMSWSVHTT